MDHAADLRGIGISHLLMVRRLTGNDRVNRRLRPAATL